MPNAAQRSKKLAAKAAQRKAVVAEKKRQGRLATSLPGRVAVAAPCPVERCQLSADLFSIGLGYVLLAKRRPSNLICTAVFLVDTFCLGVKNALYQELAPSEFEELCGKLIGSAGLVDMEPATARKLLRDAVAYAGDCGFPPHKDFSILEPMFGTVDAGQSTETFTFGRDGRPVYVPGPNDGVDRVRLIDRTLTARFGKDGWGMEMYSGLRAHDEDDFWTEDEPHKESDNADVLDDVEFKRIEPRE